MKKVFYGVWSIVGVAVLVLLSVAVFGGNSWSENLNLAQAPDTEQQQQQEVQQSQDQTQPQEPVEPTQEQLDCIAQEVGEERLAELEQGAPAQGEESVVIQQCLTS